MNHTRRAFWKMTRIHRLSLFDCNQMSPSADDGQLIDTIHILLPITREITKSPVSRKHVLPPVCCFSSYKTCQTQCVQIFYFHYQYDHEYLYYFLKCRPVKSGTSDRTFPRSQTDPAAVQSFNRFSFSPKHPVVEVSTVHFISKLHSGWVCMR